ncbi:MAG: hypothetical protein K9N35_01340 [Candidatus Marinimicrobia bacterium]|nr:hypothetical protein [Candidatus Neomarinimicrobiota bacterium]
MNTITKTDKDLILQNLSATDWDIDQELSELETVMRQPDLPRLRIEHHEEGKHRFYIDYGESYLAGKKQFSFLRAFTLPAIVFAEQQVRALWQQDEDHPRCYSIDGQVLAADPVSKSCEQCPESIPGFGSCKPKVRLFVLPLLKQANRPMVMALSPTSIKPWREHQLRLHRSGLPAVAVVTTFELEDLKSEEFRWARVRVGIRDIASRENLMAARAAQQSIDRLKNRIAPQDFSERGDRVDSD